MRRICAVCGDHEWVVGVAYSNPDSTCFFCPACIPDEFKMVVYDLPIRTPELLRWSWRKLHEPKCPYSPEQRDRAERRMYAVAKQFEITLPKIEGTR